MLIVEEIVFLPRCRLDYGQMMFDDQERAYSRCIDIKDFIKLSSYYSIRAYIYVKQ